MKRKNYSDPWLGFASAVAIVAVGIGVAMQSGTWRYHSFLLFLGLAILALITSSLVTIFWREYKPVLSFAIGVMAICALLIAWFFTGRPIPPRQYFRLEIIYIICIVLSVVSLGAAFGATLLNEVVWHKSTVVLFNLLVILFLASQLWLYLYRVLALSGRVPMETPH